MTLRLHIRTVASKTLVQGSKSLNTKYSPHLNVQMVATTSQHIFLHVKVDEDQLEKGLGFLQGVHVSVLLVPQQLAPPYDGRQ